MILKDKILQPKLDQKVQYTLRIAVAMCFIGHGAFGIITKPAWCNYFAVFGMGPDLSYQIMPVVGCFDILLGVVMLIYPVRAIPAWLVVWGVFTALLRPLSGEPLAEFIERAGNFGAPLAFLFLAGRAKNTKEWFTPIRPRVQRDGAAFKQFALCLRIAAFLLVLGHGWLNLVGKKNLLGQYTSIGFSNPEQVAQLIGMMEIAAAFILLIRPFRSLVFVLFIWKMISEIFYPQYKLFEWVERGGSYGVLLALWMVTERKTILTWPRIRLAIK
jgi:hypothetical protein